MFAITRFEVPDADAAAFRAQGEAAASLFASRPGCLDAELVRNLDAPGLWALVSRWRDVGSYRRAFNGYEAKMVLTPLMVRAIDEPGAYAALDAVGANVPRGEG